MSGLKLSKNQYAHLVRDIERLLKEHMSGGGLYDFSAPETLEYHPLSSLEFWVEDPEMEGGGFFSSIKKAANHVWGALQKSGIIDKGKDKLMKAGRELGGKAIDAAAKKADEVAKSKGFDASDITSKLAGRAHEALHDAEGHAQSLLDRGEAEVGKRLKGNGLYMSGNGNYQAGSFDGGGLYMSGNGFATSAYGTPGIPKGAYRVSAAHHLGAHPQVAAGGY